MERVRYAGVQLAAQFIIVGIGVWLIVAPGVLHYSAATIYWNEIVTGFLISALAFLRLSSPRLTWASGLHGLLGMWLIVSPLILSYQNSLAIWNELVFGIMLLSLSFGLSSTSHRHVGHPAH